MNHVFLSYRHESEIHAKSVRKLGERLKAAGLPVELDQFYIEDHPGGPDETWPKWCEDRAEKSACVLIVCSKGWFDSYRKEGVPGKGLGVALEAAVFSQKVYDDKGHNARVRLVILDDFNEDGIPHVLKVGTFSGRLAVLRNSIRWPSGSASDLQCPAVQEVLPK
jgi:TIR domain-containing protein